MIKSCLICKIEFNAFGGTKYCKEECKIIARRKADSIHHKEAYHSNPERKQKRINYATRWKKENPNKAKEIYNARNRRRRKENIKHVINNRIGPLMKRSLKYKHNSKTWHDLVGYTIDDLIARLKTTMPIGATWDNLFDGNLHIDHIIARKHWHYNSPTDAEFKQCWSLCNLQLLWAEDNLKKGVKAA